MKDELEKRPQIGDKIHSDLLDETGVVTEYHPPVNNDEFPESWTLEFKKSGQSVRLWKSGQYEPE